LKDDAGQRPASFFLPILKLDAYQVRLVEKGVDGPLQSLEIAAQFPRAVGVGLVVQDDEHPVGPVETALLRLVDVQPAGQLLWVGAGVGDVVPESARQSRQLEVEPLVVQIKVHRVVEGVRLGPGARVAQDEVERGLVGVKVVPAADDVTAEIPKRQVHLGGHASRLTAQRVQVVNLVDEAAGAVPRIALHPPPRRHALHLEQLAPNIGRMLFMRHWPVFER